MPINKFSDRTLSIVRAVIEPVLDGVYITDKVGNFIMANEAFERITGINRQELEGKHTTYLLENNWVTSAVNLEVIKDYRSRSRIVRYPSGKLILVSAGMIFRGQRTALRLYQHSQRSD
jgi:PAS domain S-box-containing protein